MENPDSFVNGIGGRQATRPAIRCKILFNDMRLVAEHDVRPTSIPGQSRLLLLGQDFMESFGLTQFDWDNNRVKLGEDWIFLSQDQEEKLKPCRYGEHIDSKTKNMFTDLVNRFNHVFTHNPKAPKMSKVGTHYIRTENDQVTFDKVRRIPNKVIDEVNMQVDEMLKNRIIRHSESQYNSNVLLTGKKDGTKRFVVDFRKLNKTTIPDKYPIPNADDIIENCLGCNFFSQLDLASGYWCVPIAENDKEKTAFTIPRGKFEFERMPFGLINSQSTFQRMIDNICKEVKNDGFKGVDAYVDNIFVSSQTSEEHYETLKRVFEAVEAYDLTLRSDKCEIALKEMNVLGFIVDGKSVRPDPENIKKLTEIKCPTNKKEVQRLIGVANFNRRFIPNFATMIKPLTALLSESVQFKWEQIHNSSFETLKSTMGKVGNLHLPDWSKDFHIHTDASGIATGATLCQRGTNDEWKTIAYHSKTLSDVQRKWNTTERELFGILDACRKWKLYCYGKVHIYTDHKPLQGIRNQKDPRGKIGRWLIELDSMDLEIHYVPGKLNTVPDFLSRDSNGAYKEEAYEEAIKNQVYMTESPAVDIKCSQKANKNIRHAVNQLQTKGRITNGPFRNLNGMSVDIHKGILLKGTRAVVPKEVAPGLIKNFHGQCHPGSEVTLALIRRHFWWKGMTRDVEAITNNCRTCKQTKSIGNPKAEIHSVIIPNIPREVLSIDIASMPETQQGERYFLVMVDMVTKFVAACPLNDQTAHSIKNALWEHWFSKFGLPSIILSDQGRNVDGEVIRKLCDNLKIEKRHTSPYHPQANAASERTIGTLKSRISAMLHSRLMPANNWNQVLQEAVLHLNNQTNGSTGYSPFTLVYGSNARTSLENLYGISSKDPEDPSGRKVMLEDALTNRSEAAQAYQKQANKNSRVHEFKPGERVLVKRSFGDNPKINVKWKDGPYHIDRKIGPANYAVRDKDGKVKVIHHDLIKKAGEVIEASYTPKPAVHQETASHNNDSSIVQMHIIPKQIPQAKLTDTIDKNAFSRKVLQQNTQIPKIDSSQNENVITTRSGRPVKPVSRLIDTINS